MHWLVKIYLYIPARLSLNLVGTCIQCTCSHFFALHYMLQNHKFLNWNTELSSNVPSCMYCFGMGLSDQLQNSLLVFGETECMAKPFSRLAAHSITF